MKQTLEHSVILPLIGPISLKVRSLKSQSHAGWWRLSYNDVTSGILCVVFNSDCRILKVTWVSLRLKSSALDCRLLNTVSSWQRKSHQSSALLALYGGNPPYILAKMAGNTETVSMFWRHHAIVTIEYICTVLMCSFYGGCVFLGRYTMMTSSNGSIFRVAGLLWRESTSYRWIP